MENLEHVSPPALATSCCCRFMRGLVTKAALQVNHSIRTRAFVSYPAPSQALLIAMTTKEAVLGAVRPLNSKCMLFVQIIYMKMFSCKFFYGAAMPLWNTDFYPEYHSAIKQPFYFSDWAWFLTFALRQRLRVLVWNGQHNDSIS